MLLVQSGGFGARLADRSGLQEEEKGDQPDPDDDQQDEAEAIHRASGEHLGRARNREDPLDLIVP